MIGRRLLEMEWRDALFLHWPVAPETVAARLPDGLSVATHGGDAYLGVVPFVMADIRPRGVPFGLSFPEVNLRTYVDGPRGRGVYFFNLDAADPVGVHVARRLFALPYYRAEMEVTTEGDRDRPVATDRRVTVTSHRIHRGADSAHVDLAYGPAGEAFEADSGSLAAFLVENYRFYAEGRRLYCGEIDHGPWPLHEADATVRTNTLFEANGFQEPDGAPLAHYSPAVDVTADRIRRVER